MSLLRTARAIAWAFFGVRKRSGYEEDLGKLNPFAIIGVALFGVVMLVVGLIVLVNWIV